MKNIKKIILFLGAIALVVWGIYARQQSTIAEVTTNNPSGNINFLGNSTTIENKSPERATSSKGKDENKNFIKKENKRAERASSSSKVQKEINQNNQKIEQKTKERATSSKNENQNKNPENKNNLEIQKENKDSGKTANEEKKTNPSEVKSSEGATSNKN